MLSFDLKPPDVDGLGERYTAIADDSSKSPKAREAAMLYAVAEGHLLEDEDYEEALKQSSAALALFKEAKDKRGMADALRLLVMAHLCKAHAMRAVKDTEGVAAAMKEAEEKARDNLGKFKSVSDRRGEATMLLSLADVCLEKVRDFQAYHEAAESAERAKAIFKELGDSVMEGNACSIAALAWVKQSDGSAVFKGAPTEAKAAATAALEIFQAADDKRGTARALHALACAISKGPRIGAEFEKGAGHLKQALALYQELELKKMEAYEAHFIATWYLLIGKAKDALPMAKLSMTVFKDINHGKCWQAESRGTVVQSYIQLQEHNDAIKTAKEGVELAKAGGDKRSTVLALEYLVQAHLEAFASNKGDLNEAMQAADEGVVICQELGDSKWEANQRHNIAQISIRLNDLVVAESALREAIQLDDKVGEYTEKAVKLHTLVDVSMQKGEPAQACEVAKAIRAIYQERGLKRHEASSCLLVAQVTMAQGNAQQALAVATEAQAIFQDVGDKKGEALTWGIIADLRRDCGEVDEALRSLRTAQALYQQASDRKAHAYSLQQMAILLVAEKRQDEAAKAANEALLLVRAAADPLAEVEMLILASQTALAALIRHASSADSGGAVFARGEDRALRPAREAVALARKLDDAYLAASAHMAVAQVHIVASRADAGVKAAEEAEKLWRSIGSTSGAAFAMLLTGEGQFVKGQAEAAKEKVNSALEIFQAAGEAEGEAKAKALLGKFEVGIPQALVAAPAAESAAAPAAPVGISFNSAKALAKNVAIEAIGSDEDIDMDSPLMDMGLDSLAAIAFREAMIQSSGLNLPTSLVFDYPSLTAIADHLVETSLGR